MTTSSALSEAASLQGAPVVLALVAPTIEQRLDSALARIEGLEREIRAAQAEQLRQIAVAHRLMRAIESHPSRSRHDDEEFVRRAMVAELATTLRVHERTASSLLFDADELDSAYDATRTALAGGAIGMTQVRDLLEYARSMPESAQPAFEAAALEKAARMTPPDSRTSNERDLQHASDPT